MAHDTPTIVARTRDHTGTRYSRRLRQSGRLPAIIYGHKTDPLAVDVDEKEMITALRHGAHVMNVEIEGGQTEMCLVKDLQYGFLGDNIIHADLTRVDLNEQVEVQVHLRFVGEPEAAKQPGAIVNTDLAQLTVTCKVSEIPEEIRVELTKTEGSVFTVGEIELPPGITTPLDPGMPVIHVSVLHKEEEEGEEVEAEAGTSPEVITESKKEDEESSA